VLPEAVGIVMTGPLLVNIFLGAEFRPLALALLPILVGATFFKALTSYMNYGYVLAARTDLTLLSIAAAAAIDLILNVILIPHYGAWGSAVAALAGFGAAFTIAALKMGRVFPFPLPEPAILAAGLLGVAAMAAWLLPFYHMTAWSTALYVIPVAMLIYFATVFLFLQLTGRKPRDLMLGLWSGEANNKTAP
jgi:O-antigen/teichoic acid export membrane protein